MIPTNLDRVHGPGLDAKALLTPSPDARRYTSAQGELTVWQPLQGLVVQKASGHATVEVAVALTKRLMSFAAFGRMVVFDDWQALTGYDSEARAAQRSCLLGSMHEICSLVYCFVIVAENL